jgi:hypothetical protein
MTASALLTALLLAVAPLPAQFGPPVLPDGLGVNIHFTDPKPGELELLAQGGFRWVRMDFVWGSTSLSKHVLQPCLNASCVASRGVLPESTVHIVALRVEARSRVFSAELRMVEGIVHLEAELQSMLSVVCHSRILE